LELKIYTINIIFHLESNAGQIDHKEEPGQKMDNISKFNVSSLSKSGGDSFSLTHKL